MPLYRYRHNGNNWVIAAIVVRLAFLDRPVALPVGFSLIRKGSDDASRLQAARRLTEALAVALPGRRINVVADSAYAGKALRGLPAEVTWTTRLRSNAALYELAPPPTGRRGRPKTKGAKLPPLASLAAHATFTPTAVTRYGLTATVQVAVIACLWYGVFGPQQVQVILVRDKAKTGYNIALVSTDLSATAAQIIERYAARWSIEVAIETPNRPSASAKPATGYGEQSNGPSPSDSSSAPSRSAGTPPPATTPTTSTAAPELAPWYRDKTQPSILDMLAKLRRVIIAAQFRQKDPLPPTPAEINLLRLAWENAAA